MEPVHAEDTMHPAALTRLRELVAPHPKAVFTVAERDATFPQLRAFDACWRNMAAEASAARSSAVKYSDVDPMQGFGGADWNVLMLVYMRQPTRHMITCPRTASLLRWLTLKGVDVRNAFFSVLGPHTRLPPHTGVLPTVLRYHLGLDCPDNDAAYLEVDGHKIGWRNGCSILWNDMYPHAATNASDQPRTILFMDVGRLDLDQDERAADEASIQSVLQSDVFQQAFARV